MVFRGWRFDWDLKNGDQVSYLDFTKVWGSKPLLVRNYKSEGEPFVRTYPPQELVTHNFDVLVPEEGSAWIGFKVDMYESGEKNAAVSWYQFKALPICGR